jgi:microcystin-dependent protein
LTGYLTPETLPTARFTRRLRLPLDQQFIANVSGALLELAEPANWTPFGAITPEEAAEAAMVMIEEYWESNMIGQLVAYVSVSPPDGTLPCDGSVYNAVDYPLLWIALDPVFYVGPDTFATPDLRGRVLLGTSATYVIGDTGGEEEHTLTIAEIPGHTHSDSGHTHADGNATPTPIAIGAGVPAPSAIPSVGVTGVGFANNASSGGDSPHNNLQPYLAVKYGIYYQ